MAAPQDEDLKVNLANKISITRIILIPFFIASVVYSRMDIALIFFTLAIISDAVDGFIARTKNQKTQFGTIIDPIADKLLLMSAFICLSIVNNIPPHIKLPPYVPIIVISRDAIIVLGSVMIHIVTGEIRIAPSIIGKMTTFFQMMTIIGVLIQFRGSYIVWNFTVFLTVLSGIDYIMKGSKTLSENHTVSRKAL